MIALAQKNNIFYFEASIVFWNPAVQFIKKELSKLRKIKLVTTNFSQYSSRYDNFKKGIYAPVFTKESAGGALMDLNVYNVNFLITLFGQPRNTYYFANIENEVDTSGVLVCDYGNFKGICIAAKNCPGPTYVCVEGDKGVLYADKPASLITGYTINLRSGEEITRNFDKNKNKFYYEFTEFISLIENNNHSKDWQYWNNMLVASQILEEGRKENNIVFPNDFD